ncbi:organic solute transporter subunit alpha-like isoform X2 [Homarus americanus]|uniref:organic solute transporter subunit alpha-like isoform X2 n=1 Tax=Homarus americanus TaxID=6706 RepID=UPI001C4673C9|nr:organic solute transporter subunit alpha-like isoform X2 [Homarus americanus]
MDHNRGMSSVLRCNNSYIPTWDEYQIALGSYGSTLLIVGGLITTGLFILFFEQVFFTHQNAHNVFRRHIYWISSVYPLMTVMSLIAVLAPRSHAICTAIKVTYMSIGISHFTDLTVLMFGSEEVMLAKTMGNRLNLQVPPSCCCCACLPRPPVTKSSLRLVMLLSDQMPFTQAAYYLILVILLSANNISLGNMNPAGVVLWLYLFNVASFSFGLYSLQILTAFSKGHLEHYNYKKKCFAMKTLVLVTNAQTLILEILGYYDVFPCIPPYLSPQVYRQTVENSIYLVEMMLLGSFTFWHYHNFMFLNANPVEVPHHGDHLSITDGSGDSTNSQKRDDNASTSTTSTIVSCESSNSILYDKNNSFGVLHSNNSNSSDVGDIKGQTNSVDNGKRVSKNSSSGNINSNVQNNSRHGKQETSTAQGDVSHKNKYHQSRQDVRLVKVQVVRQLSTEEARELEVQGDGHHNLQHFKDSMIQDNVPSTCLIIHHPVIEQQGDVPEIIVHEQGTRRLTTKQNNQKRRASF